MDFEPKLMIFVKQGTSVASSLYANENKSHSKQNPIVRIPTAVGTRGEVSNSTFHWHSYKQTLNNEDNWAQCSD